MCGICGEVRFDGREADGNVVARMSAVLSHRGPDGDGTWVEREVALGHQRLKVIDLTEAAHQPMVDRSQTAVLTYNGEVYNFKELRSELETLGHRFVSSSDTEVVLNAYVEWGEACVDRFNGHFAFAIYNQRSNQLFLARDRFGTKPLYYYRTGNHLLFASEPKAILEHPDVTASVDTRALDEYFTFQNILSDGTLFAGIRLLPPGHCVTVTQSGSWNERKYWDYDFGDTSLDITPEEAENELHRLFVQAVNRQIVADVPVGSYLSGGMDSGSITAVARQQLGRISTFTAGFDLSSASGLELGFDERAQAEFLSNVLKTEHYEMVLHAGDMEHVLPDLVWHLEDPRVGQCYPNYYVARLASKFVTVAMSGVGGDELFAGYPWRYYREVASPCSDDYLKSYYAFWQRLVPDEDKPSFYNSSVGSDLKGHSTFDVFRNVFANHELRTDTPENMVNASLYFELKTFLHGLLVVEDRVSMAHGLETRAPFLDNDLVDFALRLPVGLKLANVRQTMEIVDENDVGRRVKRAIHSDDGKRILRQAMSRTIPSEVIGRTKQGFSAPDASWFRGESIDYVNKLLRNPSARVHDYFAPDYVGRVLNDHTTGQENNRLLIWSFLCFEWWLRTFIR